MKHISPNLKRSDIPREYGGVNGVAPMEEQGSYIAQNIQRKLKVYGAEDVELIIYPPEAHLVPAVKALCEDSPVKTGCRGVYRNDTAEDDDSDAFTTNYTTNAARAMGCSLVVIGHYEERKDKAGIPKEAGVTDEGAVGRLLNQEAKATIQAGLTVLYYIGETDKEQKQWQEVLKSQLETGLRDVGKEKVVIAYEPIWTIGPSKTLSDEVCITKTGSYIKETAGGMDVVYGGSLKTDNVRVLVSVPVVDGGPVALARFQGKIGFYPEECLEIVRTYLEQDQSVWNTIENHRKTTGGLSYEVTI